mmetsp:Transcript_123596/g.394889  ORF Transcript_123596/g.394889 Transcript_123596/m.394889 type:complete len:326 (-) Transcript_123596:135-1112(-)
MAIGMVKGCVDIGGPCMDKGSCTETGTAGKLARPGRNAAQPRLRSAAQPRPQPRPHPVPQGAGDAAPQTKAPRAVVAGKPSSPASADGCQLGTTTLPSPLLRIAGATGLTDRATEARNARPCNTGLRVRALEAAPGSIGLIDRAEPTVGGWTGVGCICSCSCAPGRGKCFSAGTTGLAGAGVAAVLPASAGTENCRGLARAEDKGNRPVCAAGVGVCATLSRATRIGGGESMRKSRAGECSSGGLATSCATSRGVCVTAHAEAMRRGCGPGPGCCGGLMVTTWLMGKCDSGFCCCCVAKTNAASLFADLNPGPGPAAGGCGADAP